MGPAPAPPAPDSPKGDLGVKRDESRTYRPQYERQSWLQAGPAVDKFFDQFVPMQYEQGFVWRCQLLGQEERAIPFSKQQPRIQTLIARNAEVLLELYEATAPETLDQMRDAGKCFLTINFQDDLREEYQQTELWQAMGRQHHERWLVEYWAAIEAGRRDDIDHPGNVEFDQLPPEEIKVMQWQTYANWRILAGLSDHDYQIIRSAAVRHEVAQEAENPRPDVEPPLLLVVDDYPPFARGLVSHLERSGYRAVWCSSAESARNVIEHVDVALAIVDGDLGDKKFGPDGFSGRLVRETLIASGVSFVRLTGEPGEIPHELAGEQVFGKDQDGFLKLVADWVKANVPLPEEREY